jgi:chorismate-pyruvate lyase
MSPNYKLSKKLNSQHVAIENSIGARQSNFLCNGEKILLTEIFFKDINRFI